MLLFALYARCYNDINQKELVHESMPAVFIKQLSMNDFKVLHVPYSLPLLGFFAIRVIMRIGIFNIFTKPYAGSCK